MIIESENYKPFKDSNILIAEWIGEEIKFTCGMIVSGEVFVVEHQYNYHESLDSLLRAIQKIDAFEWPSDHPLAATFNSWRYQLLARTILTPVSELYKQVIEIIVFINKHNNTKHKITAYI